MRTWCLNSPFLIYLIIVTCLDKPKSGAHVKYFFLPFYKDVHYSVCSIIFNLPLICILKFQAKQTRKQRCLKLKTSWFQRCHITEKERSLLLVAKGLQESILYQAKAGSTCQQFFFQRTDQYQEDNLFSTANYQLTHF